jgi:hypothetical protein
MYTTKYKNKPLEYDAGIEFEDVIGFIRKYAST